MGRLPTGPPEAMKIPRSGLLTMAENAGLVLAADHK